MQTASRLLAIAALVALPAGAAAGVFPFGTIGASNPSMALQSFPQTVSISVATTGTYGLTAIGGWGGEFGIPHQDVGKTQPLLGGRPAVISGTATLTAGETILALTGAGGYRALWGSAPTNYGTRYYTEGSGGGGGTFIVADAGGKETPLVVAGGGGGYGNTVGSAGQNARLTQAGGSFTRTVGSGVTVTESGGTNGSGGQGGYTLSYNGMSPSVGGGQGGAGFSGNGGVYVAANGSHAPQPLAFENGAAGGSPASQFTMAGMGGLGGGGAGSGSQGGGGGGYSGGAGGLYGGGGGGGSYAAPSLTDVSESIWSNAMPGGGGGTFSLVFLGPSSGSSGGGGGNPVDLPIGSTLPMLGAGVAALGFMRWRRII